MPSMLKIMILPVIGESAIVSISLPEAVNLAPGVSFPFPESCRLMEVPILNGSTVTSTAGEKNQQSIA
jgi:hypothetical protein